MSSSVSHRNPFPARPGLHCKTKTGSDHGMRGDFLTSTIIKGLSVFSVNRHNFNRQTANEGNLILSSSVVVGTGWI